MMNRWKLALATAASALGFMAFTQVAWAQSTDATKGQHIQGGTQPGPGTHGHSSSPKPGETKEIQQQQHNMPATPSHSSGPATGKSGQ
ncbi:hypothetical protein SAMN02745126_04780 [Enhydrobacter aerosaccus]|uniref:Uncharacterized protein n=1 Tax=Enhydrobacter aerosaccus TaxID=225324 RepID=A0A1T4SKJ5_9HYPH|nr:hypothetical protein SAMN02745126_04780 [Enhydrobacter aerosaccus]